MDKIQEAFDKTEESPWYEEGAVEFAAQFKGEHPQRRAKSFFTGYKAGQEAKSKELENQMCANCRDRIFFMNGEADG